MVVAVPRLLEERAVFALQIPIIFWRKAQAAMIKAAVLVEDGAKEV